MSPLTSLLVEEILAFRGGDPPARGHSRATRLAERAARAACPVLIEGEAGSGSDALANAIHLCGERRARPFIRLQAGGREPAGAALFGVGESRGRRTGRFAEANGGTLLIEGIEDLPLESQAQLLRALQEGETRPLGARSRPRVDVRVIATADASLADRVRGGRFREDLYYRLQVMPITLAPLRDRRDEIPRLAAAFLARFADQERKDVRGLSDTAVDLLRAYGWPGNVRQLEAAVYRAVALAEGSVLTPFEFPQIAVRVTDVDVAIPPAPQAAPHERDGGGIPGPHALPLLGIEGEMRRLDELEAEIIRFALVHYSGRMAAVARHLGIGRSTLYRKLKELGLENPSAGVAA